MSIKKVQSSPTPKTDPTEKQYNFLDAMASVIMKQRITRLEWADPAIYVWLDTDDYLRIMLKDGKHDFIIRGVDMLSTDWVLI